MWLTIGSFLAVIIGLVLTHELGHFVTAKMSGVKVEEFGLGLPPRLLSVKRGGTLYSLNAIPLGGFVKLAGEEDPTVPGSLASKGIATRLLVLSAGSLMNFILPLLLVSIAFMIPHTLVTEDMTVYEVLPSSPAATGGLQAGDKLLEANGKPLYNSAYLDRYIQINLGREMTLTVERVDATTAAVTLVPRWRPPEGEGPLGFSALTSNQAVTSQSYPLWQAIPLSLVEYTETFTLFKNGIIGMITGAFPVVISGPVGIAQVTGEVAQGGISPLLQFAAFLSMNLAIINLFPLPALDGGRIVFVLLEWVRRGRRISARTEGLVHYIGFVLLMAAFVAITYQDIVRIINGGNLL